jgi:chromosome segregation protein
MYLEKLEIQGFKSFANKNRLIFSGLIDGEKRGLTAIVGPNGSGKSNVADAIRWVLGEQSLKTLRGKKSEDVIFSGSDKKNQLSMAEVSLFLNNSQPRKTNREENERPEEENQLDELLSSCEEITVTRRLYRSGESEYLINNSRVRLSDIQMLLAKANFGQKTYSVIGQGMVENFLSSSAAERKDFFDEATGVKQFQIKRDAALNKLENSYENLQQVDMLLSEIKPRLKSLTRQVEKLKKRDEIEKGLKQNQLNYYSLIWHDSADKLDSYNQRFLEGEKSRLELEKRLEKLNEELAKIRRTDNFQEVAELQPRLRELENRRSENLKQLAKLQAELEMQLEAQGQFDVSWLSGKQLELQSALENIKLEIKVSDNNSLADEEAEIKNRLREVEAEISEEEKELREIKHLEEERAALIKQIDKLDAVLEANLEAQGQFDVSWLSAKDNELKTESLKIQEELASLNKEIAQSNHEELEQHLSEIRKRLNSLNQEMEEENRRLKKLAAEGGKNEKISQAVEDFLQELEAIGKEDDIKKVKELIKRAKESFQEKIQILLTGKSSQELQQIKAIQEEIISLTEKRQELNDELNEEKLRLSTLNERRRLLEEKERQLSRETADITAKLAKAQIKFDASKIENEKENLRSQAEKLNKEISHRQEASNLANCLKKKEAIQEEWQRCRFKINDSLSKKRLLEEQFSRTEKELSDIAAKLAKAQVKFDASKIEEEMAVIKNRLESLENERAQVNDKLSALNAAQEKEKSLMFECQKDIQAMQAEISEVSGRLNSLQIEAARQETRLEDLENNIINDNLNIKDIKEYQADKSLDLNYLAKSLNEQKNQLEQIGGIDPEAEKEYQETKERFDFLSNQTSDLDQAIASLEKIIQELDGNIKERFDSEFKVISEKFNDYFQILFNGGSAKINKLLAEDLEKEETSKTPTDSALKPSPTENQETKTRAEERLKKLKSLRKYNSVGLAGIDIQATPPGKKIQAVSMLSGGERALTAIALICAIISANPSPFVVLDEVDAALDEANSERLARILDDLSNKTQFIVITHNRACMRKASILYGVTMEADGVSKLLSVKLDEIKK